MQNEVDALIDKLKLGKGVLGNYITIVNLPNAYLSPDECSFMHTVVAGFELVLAHGTKGNHPP